MLGYLNSFNFGTSFADAKAKLWPVLLTNWKVWPIAQVINFYAVPPHFQLLFVNAVGFFWTIYLNMMAYSDGE